ncbi:PsbP-like protein 1 [Nymphaea thermarum]|nr:PsbP-like protein 1 [Nymphaea thermarum]
MASLPALPQLGFSPCFKRRAPFLVKASHGENAVVDAQSEVVGRRQTLAMGAVAASISLLALAPVSFAAESLKGFQPVLDKTDGYSFFYPFGWQEVVVQGQDKVFKDVIEPLESVSVVNALIKKVLAPSSQTTKLIEAAEHVVDGRSYYTFEFVAKASNYTRHALGSISIANGKFYTLTTGSNERRWDKMKDKLHTVVDSFKVSTL